MKRFRLDIGVIHEKLDFEKYNCLINNPIYTRNPETEQESGQKADQEADQEEDQEEDQETDQKYDDLEIDCDADSWEITFAYASKYRGRHAE